MCVCMFVCVLIVIFIVLDSFHPRQDCRSAIVRACLLLTRANLFV